MYEGKNIPENKKSIALNVTIQSFEKTLNEDCLLYTSDAADE